MLAAIGNIKVPHSQQALRQHAGLHHGLGYNEHWEYTDGTCNHRKGRKSATHDHCEDNHVMQYATTMNTLSAGNTLAGTGDNLPTPAKLNR